MITKVPKINLNSHDFNVFLKVNLATSGHLKITGLYYMKRGTKMVTSKQVN